MKILVIADEESQKIWDFFRKEDYADIDLVISCGDLKADYLSFIATMIAVPVLYVHGNHDDKYKRKPPEGCICIEDTVYMFHGIRILGLGGSYRYKPGVNQYTEVQMERRIRRLFWKIRRKGGIDILVTRAPIRRICPPAIATPPSISFLLCGITTPSQSMIISASIDSPPFRLFFRYIKEELPLIRESSFANHLFCLRLL